MENKIVQIPDVSDEIKARWRKKTGYPCGHLTRCKGCGSGGANSCAVWGEWFKRVWVSIRKQGEKWRDAE